MREKISKEEFEAFKELKVSKNDIKEFHVYILYLAMKESYWRVEVEVWFDGSSGNGLVQVHDPKAEMILTSKTRYGETWYLI